MKHQAVIDRVKEALMSRGFSEQEALTMIRCVKTGELPEQQISPNVVEQAYKRGYYDGVKFTEERALAESLQQKTYEDQMRFMQNQYAQANYFQDGQRLANLYAGLHNTSGTR